MKKVEEYGQSARLLVYYRPVTYVDNNTLTINITDIDGYQELTVDDILVSYTADQVYHSLSGLYMNPLNYNYDSNQGVITMSASNLAGQGSSLIRGDARIMIKPTDKITTSLSGIDSSAGVMMIDLSHYENYKKITRDNIVVQFTMTPYEYHSGGGGARMVFTDYDQETGMVYIRYVGFTGNTFSQHSSTVLANMGDIIVGIKQ